MKICNIAPNAPYNDYWGYHENLLPKYQRRLGHDVTLITTNMMHKNGKIAEVSMADYVLDDGVRVIRLPQKQYSHIVMTNLFSYMNVLPYLIEIKPDFIFYHGLIGKTIFDVIEYKKKWNPKCVIVQDNHLDYNIGKNTDTLKNKFICAFFRNVNRKSIKYVSRVYGVTPWRKQYAEEYYKIPVEKTDVLIMGADDDHLDFSRRAEIRHEIRAKYGIKDDDFLICTGGKIDRKKNIHLLMNAVSGKKGTKLLVFGEVHDDVKREFEKLVAESPNVICAGWVEASRVYDYFFASDLAVFPGQHSVLWEQACAAKIPCLFMKWNGMEHVNNGGNSDFIDDITVESISSKIDEYHFTPKYEKMKKIAESELTDIYLYSRIAKKSLECAEI